ncbi:DUF1330 domain-containing protein [Sulfurimonas sp.]|uniref:DUF1330 domain-containing protein n=1 Tax=Sulfurimonas sp. TaxID=2022749 RepID=UPI002AAF90BE|nr:DUF1330 domain-containing protein [Sulfurimonas sp.]
MPHYLVGQITVKNETLWQEYILGVQKSLLNFEAEIIFRGKSSSVLAGKNNKELIVVVKFSDKTTLDAWFNSKKYQSIIATRDAAADVVITCYDEY